MLIRNPTEATGPVKCDIPYLRLTCPRCIKQFSEQWDRKYLFAEVTVVCPSCGCGFVRYVRENTDGGYEVATDKGFTKVV